MLMELLRIASLLAAMPWRLVRQHIRLGDLTWRAFLPIS
uniref:Uncharacterized protein n=1 Tax=Rhizophora mucronata TaxID=61149 RepID=A0A2P2P9S6_RHIMU